VPKTTINEDCDFLQRKDEVRSARQKRTSAPAGQAMATKNFNQMKFSALVATALNSLHESRACRSGGKFVSTFRRRGQTLATSHA
jgi:hypothetical protein